LAIGRQQTKKRQPPVPIPKRLLAPMRRWRHRGVSTKAVVEWNGKPVKSVRKGFEAAVRAAGIGTDVTPHILRHTCATWLMQAGVDLWDAAGFLGMTVQQLEHGYGHHHPDYLHKAAAALSGQNAARNSVNKTRGTNTNTTKIAEISSDDSNTPRSGRGGRRFKSCHSDQHLAHIPIRSAKGSAKGSRDEGRTPSTTENLSTYFTRTLSLIARPCAAAPCSTAPTFQACSWMLSSHYRMQPLEPVMITWPFRSS